MIRFIKTYIEAKGAVMGILSKTTSISLRKELEELADKIDAMAAAQKMKDTSEEFIAGANVFDDINKITKDYRKGL